MAQLRLQTGDRVLDVGCGTGGGDFLMASQHGASVHGIDLSVNMVLMALERAQQEQAASVRRISRGMPAVTGALGRMTTVSSR